MNPALKPLIKMIEDLSHRHSRHHVFSDFVELAALSFANAVDKLQFEPREARYFEIIKRYKPDELAIFPKMIGELVNVFHDHGPGDHLGTLFHELELHNTYKGQFFTPYELCRLMAMMTMPQDLQAEIDKHGFITMQEPACGAGATVIAFAAEMQAAGINYQERLHVTAIDIDPRCVHMAYVQFTLMHIPAVIVHGNTLSLEEFGHWYTPAHIMGAWSYRLKRGGPLQLVDDFTEAANPGPAPATMSSPIEEPKPYVKPEQLVLL